MGSTTLDGDLLGTLAVAMSKHGMMMPYLSLNKRTSAERAAVVLLCSHVKTSFTPKLSETKLEMQPELIDHEMRARADMLALAAATKVFHVSPAALACAVVLMAVPAYDCILRTLLLRVTLAGDLACLKELIEIYLHMWKQQHSHRGNRGIYGSIFLDCMPYAIVKRRHLHLAELLQADLRAMQTRAEWTVRTNQPDPDGMCTKSGLDKRFPLFGGKTLLMIACGAGDATCAEMLLTGVTGRFMVMDPENDGSFTMKSITMRSGIDEEVRDDRWETSYDGWLSPAGDTALMVAVREGNVDCARVLLAHEADVSKVVKTDNGMTAILYACDKGRHELLELLLAHKATVSQKCFDYAAFAGVFDHPHSLPMSILLDQGMCFHDEGHARCLQILLERELVPKGALTLSDGYGAYPLHLAAILQRSNCVKILAAATPQFLNRADDRGYTPLLYALGAVDESSIKYRQKWRGWSTAVTATVAALLEAKADPELDHPFHIPLFLACGLNGSVDCTQMLLNAGANPARRPAKYDEGYTSVHSGICYGELECVRMILAHRPDVVNVVSKERDMTPLALACQPDLHHPDIEEYRPDHKPEQFVALLLDARADVRIRDNMSRTALHHIAFQRDWNALDGRADRTGAAGLIEMVLKNNASHARKLRTDIVDATDASGITALMLACARKHFHAVKALLAGGASVNLSRPEGKMSGVTDKKTTALMYAVKEGTDINFPSIDQVKDPIVPLLLAHGANPNAENPENETALTLAARKNSQRDIEYLVQAGARVNQVDNGGKTPMHHLARWNEDDRPGTADAIRLLSQHDANPDVQDNNGYSPLIIAARESNCHQVVRALLEAAADRTLVDGEGKTALEYGRSAAILRMLRGELE